MAITVFFRDKLSKVLVNTSLHQTVFLGNTLSITHHRGLKEKGLLNELPDLSDLEDGDLKYKVDFKNVYATVLNKWLGADDEKIMGGKFEHLKFL